MICFDSDDFGCSHVISDQCQSHDCRDMLQSFKNHNKYFKATLFAIPGEMTAELTAWCQLNRDWIELAVHGFFHRSNYECEKLSYDDFDFLMNEFKDITNTCFVKGFKAPGWQVGDEVYAWLKDNGYWVADQDYNDDRRPKKLPVYKVDEFSIHTHTWNCVGNGVYELHDEIIKRIKGETDFRFVSEVVA